MSQLSVAFTGTVMSPLPPDASVNAQASFLPLTARLVPYRTEVIIRSAGAIVRGEVLMVIGIAGCETESGFTVASLKADRNTVQDLEDNPVRWQCRTPVALPA